MVKEPNEEDLERDEAFQEQYDLQDWEDELLWREKNKELEKLPPEDCPYWEE